MKLVLLSIMGKIWSCPEARSSVPRSPPWKKCQHAGMSTNVLGSSRQYCLQKSQNPKPKWPTTLISNHRGMDKVCSRLGKRPEPEGSLNYTPIKKKKKKKRATETKQKKHKNRHRWPMVLGIRILVTPEVLRNSDWQRHKNVVSESG